MNKIIFIFLFLLSATLCPKSFADTNYTPVAQKSFVLSKHTNVVKEKKSDFNIVDLNTSNKVPDSQKKKKRAKGIQPEYGCLFSKNTIFKPNAMKSEYALTTQKFYFLRLFFSDEKSGPPAVL